SFSQKLINVTLTMAQGSTPGAAPAAAPDPTIISDIGSGFSGTLSGHRVSVKLTKTSGPDVGFAEIAIYGLPLTTMNQYSTTGTQWTKVGQNSVLVQAGDTQLGMTTVFEGTILYCF